MVLDAGAFGKIMSVLWQASAVHIVVHILSS
jgi:hypothetical protein